MALHMSSSCLELSSKVCKACKSQRLIPREGEGTIPELEECPSQGHEAQGNVLSFSAPSDCKLRGAIEHSRAKHPCGLTEAKVEHSTWHGGTALKHERLQQKCSPRHRLLRTPHPPAGQQARLLPRRPVLAGYELRSQRWCAVCAVEETKWGHTANSSSS